MTTIDIPAMNVGPEDFFWGDPEAVRKTEGGLIRLGFTKVETHRAFPRPGRTAYLCLGDVFFADSILIVMRSGAYLRSINFALFQRIRRGLILERLMHLGFNCEHGGKTSPVLTSSALV